MAAFLEPQGIAIVLGALGLFITTVGGLALQVATFRRSGRLGAKQDVMQAQAENSAIKLAEVHDLVNGQSEKLATAIEQRAFAEGVKSEVDRTADQSDSPSTDPVK